jgi:hypothetical protein
MKSEVPRDARTVRTEWSEWDLTNEAWKAPRSVTIEEYRPDGKLLVCETHNPDGLVCRSTNSYDDGGLLTASEVRDNRGASSRLVSLYDDSGRLIRQVSHGPDGSEHVIEEHAYAVDGSHTSIRPVPQIEGVTDYYCPIDGVDYYFNAPGTTTMTTAFDNQGRSSELLLKDSDGGVLRGVTLTHDESGRLVKDEIFLGGLPLVPDIPMFGSGMALMTTEYTYDERGRCVEQVRRMFGLSEERITTQYDDHGNRTETTTEHQSREANVNEGNIEYGAPTIRRAQARFTYKFDDRGNWSERVISQRHGENPDFTPCSIERREIAYYEL